MATATRPPQGRGAFRTLHHPSDLAALSVLPLMQPRPRGRIVIADDGLDGGLKKDWEARLNRAYHACGCGEASLGVLAALVGGGVWTAWLWASGAAIGWRHAGLVLAVVIAGQVLGKFAGLVRAQARLRSLATEISSDWKSPPRSLSHENCG